MSAIFGQSYKYYVKANQYPWINVITNCFKIIIMDTIDSNRFNRLYYLVLDEDIVLLLCVFWCTVFSLIRNEYLNWIIALL